jgi:hypothetical protein
MAAGLSDFAVNESALRRMLLTEGADNASAVHIAARLTSWFKTAAQRDNVKFLFDAAHAESANELSLIDTNQDQLRLDRTFVTADGERWLVDFKFSEPGDAVAIATEAERYRPQLARYVKLLAEMDRALGTERPIRVALYFPWFDLLHQIAI